MKHSSILVVEDNEHDAFFLQRAFKEVKLENPVTIMTDGQKAIDFLTGKGVYQDRSDFSLPALVLLDLKLPYKTGFDVLSAIRSFNDTSILPVVILTSSREKKDIEEAFRLGANAFIVKPSSPSELEALSRAIKDFWIQFNQIAH